MINYGNWNCILSIGYICIFGVWLFFFDIYLSFWWFVFFVLYKNKLSLLWKSDLWIIKYIGFGLVLLLKVLWDLI